MGKMRSVTWNFAGAAEKRKMKSSHYWVLLMMHAQATATSKLGQGMQESSFFMFSLMCLCLTAKKKKTTKKQA